MTTDDTRHAYDTTADVYVERIGTEINPEFEGPVDRALLAAFVEMVGGAGTVADLGCGPGRTAAMLRRAGLDVVGVDLSIGMLVEARRAHSGLAAAQGDLAALPLRSHSCAAAVLWYSIVHAPADTLPTLFAEVRRILVDDAPVIVGFQAGDGDHVHRTELGGRPVSLIRYNHSPAVVGNAMAASGLTVESTTVRAPMNDEPTPQAFLIARATG